MGRTLVIGILGGFLGSLLLGGTYALATNFNFVLGSTANQPDALTAVTAKNVDGQGGLSGPMIRLTNNSTATNATALALGVNKNRAPFTTSSSVKVTNLNADKLDGIDSTGFVKGGGATLEGHAFVPPGTPSDSAVFHHSTQVPAFDIDYGCPSDPSQGGTVLFANRSQATAELEEMIVHGSAAQTTHVTSGPDNANGYVTDPAGSVSMFDVYWDDQHFATIRVATYQLANTPDPRDEGCYATIMGVAH